MSKKKAKSKRPKLYRKPRIFRGKSPLRRIEDDSTKALRRKIWKRDKGKCQFAGCKSRGAHCHHIFPYATHIGWRNSETNIILLCAAHHKQVTGHELEYALAFINTISRNNE